MKDVELRVHAPSHSGGARDEILPGRIRGNANGQALAHTPVLANVLRLHVGLEAAIDLFGHLAQGQLAKRDQIAAAEEIVQGAFDFIRAVNVAALHAVLKSLRSQIDHNGFGSGEGHPVRNRLAHDNSGDRAHYRRDAFNVLNVERGDDVDIGGENLLDVFVALAVLAAGNIGMSKFIDEHDGGAPCQNGIDVHLFKDGAFVLNLPARNVFQLFDKLLDALATVCFDDTDDHVFAAAAAANRFAQHAEGFSNAGSVTEKQLELPAGLLRGRNSFQPFFGFLGQAYLRRKPEAWARIGRCKDSSAGAPWDWWLPWSRWSASF